MHRAIHPKLLWRNEKRERLEFQMPIVKNHMIKILSKVNSFVCIDFLCKLIQPKITKLKYEDLKSLIIDLGILNHYSFTFNEHNNEIMYNQKNNLHDLDLELGI
jgi:hypothetical protein